MSNQQEQKLVEVTLEKPHTHRGVAHPTGAKIKVTEPEREWLKAADVIESKAKGEAK